MMRFANDPDKFVQLNGPLYLGQDGRLHQVPDHEAPPFSRTADELPAGRRTVFNANGAIIGEVMCAADDGEVLTVSLPTRDVR